MKRIDVELGARSYPILVGSGMLSMAGSWIARELQPTQVVVLTHPRLMDAFASQVARDIQSAGVPCSLIVTPAGERFKTLRTVGKLLEQLADQKLDRKSVLVTVGGGVLGDVGGFVAASYMRGIRFVQFPTTLLAQVDASVGGKTGVDLPQGKNLVGAFHQPCGVLIDPDTLRSLPPRELRSGLAEVVKYGIICDRQFSDWIDGNTSSLLSREPSVMETAVAECCRLKAEVVGEDETEQGRRAILNFGHTVGHALESVTQYRRFKHGEAVAVGMVSAMLIGEELGVTSPSLTAHLVASLKRLGLPTRFPSDIAVTSVLEAMLRDKKATGGRVRFVLATEPGCVQSFDSVTNEIVASALARQCG